MKLKKKLIVYDFDKTIYGGETGTNFFKFYFKKFPLKSLVFIVLYVEDILFYIFKQIKLKQLKERFFRFLEGHSKEEIDKLVTEFWEIEKNKIYDWAKDELAENKKQVDLVIITSASPKFIIEKFLLDFGYDLVFGTEFVKFDNDRFISKIYGENNKNDEKVKKLKIWAKKQKISFEILKFYSDSIADQPLYDLAKEKVWVNKGEKIEGIPKQKTLLDKLFWK